MQDHADGYLHCGFLFLTSFLLIYPPNEKPLHSDYLLTRSTLHPQAGSNPAPIPAAKAVRSVENRIYPARGARREEHRARNCLSGTIIQKTSYHFVTPRGSQRYQERPRKGRRAFARSSDACAAVQGRAGAADQHSPSFFCRPTCRRSSIGRAAAL